MHTAGAVEPPPGRHPIHDLRGPEGSPAGGSNSAPATPLQGSQTPAGGGVRRFEPREFASPAAFRDRFEAGGLDGGFGSPSASAGRADESAQAQPGGGRAVEDPPWEARNSRAAEGGPEYAEGGVPASPRAEAQHPPRAEDPAQRQGADETAAGTPGDTPSTSSAYGAYRQRLRGTPGSSRRLLHQTSDVGELTTPSGSGSEGGDWGSEDIDSMTAKSAKARKKALRRAMRHKYEQKLRDGWGRRGGSEPEPEDFYRNGGSPSPDAAPAALGDGPPARVSSIPGRRSSTVREAGCRGTTCGTAFRRSPPCRRFWRPWRAPRALPCCSSSRCCSSRCGTSRPSSTRRPFSTSRRRRRCKRRLCNSSSSSCGSRR